MTAWSLWTARNKFHFEQVQTPPTMIFRRASSLLDKYQQLMAALPSWQALLACLSLIYRLYILYLFLCIFFLYSLSPSRWLATALAVLFCLPSVGFCRVLFFFFILIYFYRLLSKKKRKKKRGIETILIYEKVQPQEVIIFLEEP